MSSYAINIAVDSQESKQLQAAVQKEMVARGYMEEGESTMSEYAVIMLVNSKPEADINKEISEILPEYDPQFTKWMFETAAEITAKAAASAAAAAKGTSTPIYAASAGRSSPSSPLPNGVSPRKRAASRSLSPENSKVARTSDLPDRPRAMRERGAVLPEKPNGSVRSLLDRVGPPVRNRTDDVQARIDRITAAAAATGVPQQEWQPMNGNMANGVDPVQQRWQEMMNMQMAMMHQMAMMNGGAGFLPGAMGMNMNMNGGMGTYDRGRQVARGGRGRGTWRNQRNFRDEDGAFGQDNVAIVPTLPAAFEPPAGPVSPPETVINLELPARGPPAPAPAPASAPHTQRHSASLTSRPSAAVVTIKPDNGPPALCKFSVKCTNAACPFAHPSPAATVESGLVLSSEACPDGRDCKDADCTKIHPSPAKPEAAVPYTKLTVATAISKPLVPQAKMCKFGSHCTRPDCIFVHPWDKAAMAERPCRYGAACTRADCAFSHPPGRVLPSSFHTGLDDSTPSAVKAPVHPHGANGTYVSRNKTQVFNVAAKPFTPAAQPTPTVVPDVVTDKVADEVAEEVAEAAQVAEELVQVAAELVESVEKVVERQTDEVTA